MKFIKMILSKGICVLILNYIFSIIIYDVPKYNPQNILTMFFMFLPFSILYIITSIIFYLKFDNLNLLTKIFINYFSILFITACFKIGDKSSFSYEFANEIIYYYYFLFFIIAFTEIFYHYFKKVSTN